MPVLPAPTNDGSQQVLDAARSQATQSLQGVLPNTMLAPPGNGFGHVKLSGQMAQQPNPQAALPEAPDQASAEPLQEAVPDAPAPTAEPAAESKPAAFDGFWKTFTNKMASGLLSAGKGIADLAVGDLSYITPQKFSDTMFKAVDDTFNPAMEHWQQNQADFEATGKVGKGAKLVGQGVEGLAPILLGPEAMMASSTMGAATNSIDQNQDLKTAYKLAGINLMANAVGMKIPMGSKLATRIVSGAAGNVGVSAASEYLTKEVLDSDGYKDAAKKVDPTDPGSLISSGLLGAVFGVLAKPHVQKEFVKKGGTLPESPPPDDLNNGTAPGATPPPEGAPPAIVPDIPPAEPHTGVMEAFNKYQSDTAKSQKITAAFDDKLRPVDTPTAEPVQDLKAQVADMHDPATARKAVYLAPDNVAALGAEGLADLAKGTIQLRNFDKKGGVLLVPDAAGAKAARALRMSNPDMQSVLGQLTGAGEGKASEQTAVVQGHTPEGAVATEGAVTPAEIPGKVAEVSAEGKTPVVTTPEEAVARREALAPPPAEPAATAEPIPQGPHIAEFKGDPEHTWALYDAKGEAVYKFKDEAAAQARFDDLMAQTHTGVMGSRAEDSGGKAGTRQHPEGTKGVVKNDRREQAAEVAGPAKEGKLPVRLFDQEGERGEVTQVNAADFYAGEKVSGERRKVKGRTMAEMAKKPANEREVSLDLNVPAKAKKAPVPGVGALDVPKVEAPSGADRTVSEPAKPQAAENTGHTEPAVGDVRDIHPMLDQLADARDMLKAQETPPKGKKFPASVKERAGNLATFGRALKGIAQSLKAEHAAPERIHAALDAASKVERLDLKSDEAMAKNQGVGHPQLAAHAQRLLDAAEGLLNKNHIPTNVEPARVTQLKKRAAKLRAEKEAPKAAEPAKIKVMEDIPDARKPTEITKGEQLKLRAAGKEYINAKPHDLEARRAAVEHMVDEIMGERMSPDDKAMFLYNLEAERRERARPKTRDEEVDEEFSDHRWENPAHASEAELRDYKEAKAADKLWGKAEASMDTAGFLDHLGDLRDRQQPASLHATLDYALKHMEAGPARGILQNIRKLSRDLPVHFVDTIIGRSNGEALDKTAGLYTFLPKHGMEDIQVSLTSKNHPLRTLVHEAVHGATYQFMRANPNHPFTREMERLRFIAQARFEKMYNEQLATTGAGMGRHYGLTNADEFVAEALTSSKFQQFLMDSEKYATPTEKLRTLVSQLGNALRKLFGIKDGAQAKLFDNVLDLSGRVMKAQHEMLTPKDDFLPGLDEALGANDHPLVEAIGELRSLDDDEPRMLPGERKLRDIAGNAAADTARDFVRSTRAGAVRALRKLVLANSTHDQMMRTNAHWFGPMDESNPVKQVEAAEAKRTTIQNKMMNRAGEITARRGKLPREQDRRLGQLQIDTTVWGVDPRLASDKQMKTSMSVPNYEARYGDIKARWNKLSPEAQAIYDDERAHNEWAARQNRKAAIDVALDTYSDKDVTEAQRVLLYSARTKGDYGALIGPGKLIDVADRNQDLIDSLENTAGLRQSEGPYFHLGRHGDLVVQATPEGTKEFPNEERANEFAERVRGLSPDSEANVDFLGGKWTVSYKAEYTSMHENTAEAEAAADRMRNAGFDVGPVTEKVLSESTAPLAGGVQNLIAEATRRLERNGSGADTEALVQSLRTSFVQMLAARSAYAASKLARKGVAGVKAEEMGRNFANHAQSVAWNTGHLATVFEHGEALGRIREAAKNPHEVSQKVAYKRGAFMAELGKRMQQEVAQYGTRTWGNSVMAKMGFMNFLASPSHAAIWMTQNFTTSMPLAGARWGYGKATAAFSKSMSLVGGPAFRSSFLAHLRPGKYDANTILDAVVHAVQKDKTLGKWAQGDNSHLRQLIERGMIQSSFAQEISSMSRGTNKTINRVFEYARLLPHMADVFNRISTGLAGLEMTGGDIPKALDFVRETHMDYGQSNKSRVFKSFSKVPMMNSVTMFRTYTQGMAHLLYSNIKNMVYAESKSRGEAAKTVAGMVLGTSLAAGVLKGAMLEPLRLAVYAYNKVFGDDDEYHDLDNTVRRLVADATGNDATTQAITGGLPRLLGFDLSSRMGLADLFLHDPPDLLSADKDKITEFAASLMGPMPQMVADNYTSSRDAFQRGDVFDSMMSLVPVKALHDAQKAYTLYSTGKQSVAGGQLTEPSTADAVTQLLGFKPASVANVQERMGSGYGYRQFESDRKYELLKQFNAAPSDDRSTVMEKIQQFNQANPGMKITYSDFLKQRRSAQRGEAMATGGQTRDPGVNERTNY